MRKSIIFLIIASLLFSSCGLSSGGTSSAPKQDESGNGLKVNFDIDDSWVSEGYVDYYISFENSGKDVIELNENNFRLTTLQVSAESLNTPFFTQDSLDDFYQRLFGEGSIILFQNTDPIERSGRLVLEEGYISTSTNEDIDYELTITYPYKTDFSNNVEIDLSKSRNKLDIIDKLSQAAPVKVKDIEIKPLGSQGYEILYYIENPQRKNRAVISDIEITFGANNRLSRCNSFVEEGSRFSGVSLPIILQEGPTNLDDDLSSFIYKCEVDLEDVTTSDATTFITSGTIEYEYRVIIEDSIGLSKIRN